MTARAVVFHGPRQPLEVRRLDPPQPRGEEILVAVRGCTLCGSDLHTFDGRRETPTPTVLGHEIVGQIEALGEAAPNSDLAGQPLRVGDRVIWSLVTRCGACFYCRRDLPQKCSRGIKYGHQRFEVGREWLGGLADLCLLAPGTQVMRLPDGLPLEVACPASCGTATVAAAVAATGSLQDRSVCLLGAGLLGLTAAAMARSAGAAHVVCVEVDPARLARATQFGATDAATPERLPEVKAAVTDGHGFDVVFEFSGNPDAVQSAWQQARLGGTIVLVGSVFPSPPWAIPPDAIVRRNLTICGVHNYQPSDLQRAVAFLDQHGDAFPFAELCSDWFPLEQAEAAFQAARDPRHIRVGVRPHR